MYTLLKDEMNEQDYYDLMSDVTNMNVLSGEEVRKQHVLIGIVGAWPVFSYEVEEGQHSEFRGNLLSNVNSNLQRYTDMLLAVSDPNWHCSGQDTQKAKNDVLNQKYVYQKLASIYSLIKRDE